MEWVAKGKGGGMNMRKAKKLGDWLNYTVGFSGVGPTLLDKEPPRKLGRKEKILFNKMLPKVKEVYGKAKQDAFRQACIEVLGEDPDTDWD